MTLYNLTWMGSVTNIFDLYIGIQNLISPDYLVGHLLLTAFFLVFLVNSFRAGDMTPVVIGSLLTGVLAILLWPTGLIPATTISYPFVIFVVSAIFLFIDR